MELKLIWIMLLSLKGKDKYLAMSLNFGSLTHTTVVMLPLHGKYAKINNKMKQSPQKRHIFFVNENRLTK
jgi:hypothetical protein